VHGRDYCPVALPYFGFVWRRDTLSAVRRDAYAWSAQRHRVPVALRVLRLAPTWPFIAARNALRAVRAWGAEVATLDGVSRPVQFLQLLRLAVTENLSAESYYAYGLWRPGARARAVRYLQEFEVMWACEHAHAGLDAGVMKDKRRFAAACAALGLPTVPVLASFGAGAAGGDGERHSPATPPADDLFAKPATLACGTGVQRWRFDGSAWHRDGRRFDWHGLRAHLAAEDCPGGLMLQPFVRNHPAQARFTGGALATLRVFSCRLPGGRARPLLCTWRMPVGDAEADNFSAGGISAPVSADGVLGRGRRKRIGPLVDVHPDTGTTFAGVALPGFAELRDLALRAHDTLQFDGFVGWDVAWGPDGPLLVEGNPTWGPNVLQCSHDLPLGDTAVPALLEALGRAAVERRRDTAERAVAIATRPQVTG
jgi:hypothetical protein